MPELAEVSRIVHFLSEYVVGKTLTKVTTTNDDIVYGKAGTSASEFQKAMEGKRVVSAGQQGKYFWMIMSEPPHAVMHFGMSGWLKFDGVDTYYYRSDKHEDEEWPPKHWKFLLETDGEPKTEAAFVDVRRLSRVHLVDCPAEDIRKYSPLKNHGPDPILDKNILTEEWLAKKIKSKKVPVKVFLLDQANISGIGNWMGDEILYHAKIYPEQYSNTLTDEQIKQLYSSINYVCTTAVHLLADSEQFPKDWLFKYRWGKGKKNHTSVLPNGEKIIFLTVGGRTSAVVPSVQKKTGPVAKDISEEDIDVPKSETKRKRATAVEKEEEVDGVEEKPKPKKQGLSRRSKPSEDAVESKAESITQGRRRSTRLRK
ncbi:putative formamidopyrimidine-DNA glycosylase [Aspergillus clavatus NRRL 1]|uniref:Formamidopyrimidine-DNA glycosylase, putative n=1 Tax=Aspergillus clavatus (strain ATCC 1007 / CBS 513.65 / DSM 816 / NCTC 3887 / NRRL 1 / QM 1276 / 107) TaxID=344612 RepID=A1CIC0_ASPCL|nr:Formamidopyrimidine-DNA glycosylase, putative [Aspergillus clavatus NRRL 1]EAW10625.1 Formamidopyrimidine-DNA glycosylase, putative [Aspergillus clavatus NRRL 1]